MDRWTDGRSYEKKTRVLQDTVLFDGAALRRITENYRCTAGQGYCVFLTDLMIESLVRPKFLDVKEPKFLPRFMFFSFPFEWIKRPHRNNVKGGI